MPRSKRPVFSPWPVSPAPWVDLAWRATATALASAEVIARRTTRMATMGSTPTAADRYEWQRMVDEKIAATDESTQAMGRQVAAWMQSSAWPWLALAWLPARTLLGPPRAPTGLPDGAAMWRESAALATAGLAPFQRRATANARRLRKQR